MAESKTVKVKRLGDLTKILAGPEEDKELFTPTRGASGDTPAYEENYDIGQSDNKSGRGMGWYVVHTYSGYEKKVKLNIEKAIENRRTHAGCNRDKGNGQEDCSEKGRTRICPHPHGCR